jgi:addiction module RelE/StbE family toxin
VLEVLIAYSAIGVACIPLTEYAMYTTDDTSKHEEPLVFFLAVFAICWATIPLWPAITYLIVNHVVLKRRSKGEIKPKLEWDALEEAWLNITLMSDELDQTLNKFLDSDQIQGKAEGEIRRRFSELEIEYDRWFNIKRQVESYLDIGPLSESEKIYEQYLREGAAWPRINVYVDFYYDLSTNTRKISHSTIRSFFLEEQEEVILGNQEKHKPEVLYHRLPLAISSPISNEEEYLPWRISMSGRFNAIVKKLRGAERDKIEFAVSNIMLSPTTATGNTKTPLSNNLRDFWRYRLGDWRIIYTVDSHAKVVTILDYTHRSKAYH